MTKTDKIIWFAVAFTLGFAISTMIFYGTHTSQSDLEAARYKGYLQVVGLGYDTTGEQCEYRVSNHKKITWTKGNAPNFWVSGPKIITDNFLNRTGYIRALLWRNDTIHCDTIWWKDDTLDGEVGK